MKGLTVTAGSQKDVHLCFDADLMRVAMGWTGAFLEFGDTQSQIAWPPPPEVKGRYVFANRQTPGWARQGSFDDPRPRQLGPLPKDWAHFRGLYLHGDQVVFEYRLGQHTVLEHPSAFEHENHRWLVRTFHFDSESAEQTLLVADGMDGESQSDFGGSSGFGAVTWMKGKPLMVAGKGIPAGAKLESTRERRLVLKLPRIQAQQSFQIAIGEVTHAEALTRWREIPIPNVKDWTRGGPPRWPETAVTQGTRGSGSEAYVIDTITEPVHNPYHAKMFFGGFDFFEDGRAAICTFHGDVWIVSGLDEGLNRVVWRRYAAGLFQPLGVKVIRGELFVLGRDQITRLRDLNGDGEADFYENFNNDSIVTANYHEFSMDLQTDRAGNFYYAKGAPWEPEVISPHQGTVLKVRADGSALEVFASGLRAPNGLAIGPGDEITVSDNQGHWIPSSKLNRVERGGFYGMVPTAQKELRFERGGTPLTLNPSDPQARRQHQLKTWDAGSPSPSTYDPPMVWLPMQMDNSSGGQLWTTGAKWGPLSDRLLFMSYGRCTLFDVLMQDVGGVKQGAMVQLPLRFFTGIMRGRVNPVDGQVYLCGLKGWQTSATRDGGFYRVRYTGKPVRWPLRFAATRQGVKLGFSAPLEASSASDPANFSVERWNYQYSGGYGSPEFAVSNPTLKKREPMEVTSAKVSGDGLEIAIELKDMRPCDQIRIRYQLQSKDGVSVSHDMYGTIHQLADP
ncbi:MAG: hypothetical protein FJ404_12960 [Verrucomicrobia bacterium]|nr:hypothetical protein [Verrucomicrobiota bacterium]